MEYIPLGKTDLMVSRTAFGCLSLQRIKDLNEAAALIRNAYEKGVNFFDTARSYTDSEEKIGLSLDEIRNDVYLATKTAAASPTALHNDLETSLRALQTDYIDLYQLHNPAFLPEPGGKDGLYDALLLAKKKGLIRYIGVSSQSLSIARQVIESNLYDVIQMPVSYLAIQEELDLASLCQKNECGLLAMMPLASGLITNIEAAFAWMRQFEHIVPLWGIQSEKELNSFISYEKEAPVLNEDLQSAIREDQKKLSSLFCRGCGYCLPCPVHIPINTANRMSQLLRTSPTEQWLTPEWQERMNRINDCTQCGLCEKRCPYGLVPYKTMPAHLEDYRASFKSRVLL